MDNVAFHKFILGSHPNLALKYFENANRPEDPHSRRFASSIQILTRVKLNILEAKPQVFLN